jgi:di/tricarboxylate transporter
MVLSMADSTITFIVLGAVVVLFVSNRIPVAVIAIATSLSLWATGILELEEATAGFGNPTVLFIAALFVVSESLDSTGVTAWVGQQVIERAGDSRSRILTYIAVVCALLTAFITPNASVAALVPVVVVIAVRVGHPTSQLMMPLAFAAHAGSLLALTGSPVSVVVSDAAEEAGAGRFGFFEFALAGIPVAIGTIAILLLLGPKLLPHRTPDSLPNDLTALEPMLLRQYRIDGERADRLYGRRYGVAELVVPPRSALIGRRFRRGMITDSGELEVVAVLRDDEPVENGGVDLLTGDVILVRGTWTALSRQIALDDAVLTVDEPDAVRRQVVPLGEGAKRSLAILAAMIVLLATDAVPPAVASLLAAGAVILLGIVPIEQAFRSISWTTVILVGGMFPLSVAMQETGAAELLAGRLVDIVGDSGPYPLLIGLFILTAVLGQLISNMATALIVIPVALSAAAELDVAVAPVLMCLNVATSAALLTPVATPANLMVMEPGGYQFGDYWKMGLPLLAWYFVVAVFWVPIIWRF